MLGEEGAYSELRTGTINFPVKLNSNKCRMQGPPLLFQRRTSKAMFFSLESTSVVIVPATITGSMLDPLADPVVAVP